MSSQHQALDGSYTNLDCQGGISGPANDSPPPILSWHTYPKEGYFRANDLHMIEPTNAAAAFYGKGSINGWGKEPTAVLRELFFNITQPADVDGA